MRSEFIPEFILLQEFNGDKIHIPGYRLITSKTTLDSLNSQRHGTALYVFSGALGEYKLIFEQIDHMKFLDRNGINEDQYSIMTEISISIIRVKKVKITDQNGNYDDTGKYSIIANCYVPNNSSKFKGNREKAYYIMEEILPRLHQMVINGEIDELLIFGDFNAPSCQWSPKERIPKIKRNDHNSELLEKMFRKCDNFIQHVMFNTSFNLTGETLIDLFIRASNTGEVSVIDAGNIQPYTFHRGLLVKTPIRKNDQDKSETDSTNNILIRTPISDSILRSKVDWKSITLGHFPYDKIVSPSTDIVQYIPKDNTFTIFNKKTERQNQSIKTKNVQRKDTKQIKMDKLSEGLDKLSFLTE
jgi:hypothetical protein